MPAVDNNVQMITYRDGGNRSVSTGKGRFDLIPWEALLEWALVYEEGAAGHGERNWERGLPISRCCDSGIRHAYQAKEGLIDERHAGQSMWNMAAYISICHWVKQGKLPVKWIDLPNHEWCIPEGYLNEYHARLNGTWVDITEESKKLAENMIGMNLSLTNHQR